MASTAPAHSRALAPLDQVSTQSKTTFTHTPTYGDFDRNLSLPSSVLMRWAMEARVRSDVVRRLASFDPTKRFMVKAQVVRRHEPAIQSVRIGSSHVTVTQTPHAWSNSSFTLAYDLSLIHI